MNPLKSAFREWLSRLALRALRWWRLHVVTEDPHQGELRAEVHAAVEAARRERGRSAAGWRYTIGNERGEVREVVYAGSRDAMLTGILAGLEATGFDLLYPNEQRRAA